MTSTNNSTLIFIAMLLVLSNGCAHSVGPDCAPVSTNYIPASTNYPDIAKNEPEYYRVKKDDTLYAISRLFDLDYRQLAQWNQIAPPFYTIEIGQKIRLSDPIWENNPKGTAPRMGDVESRPERRSIATHGAVAVTTQKIVGATATKRMSSYKTQPLKNPSEKYGNNP